MIKGIVFPTLFCLLTLSVLSAQNIRFGIKAGPQFSTYTEVNDAKTALRWHAGGFAELQLPNRLQALAGLELSSQGVNDSESDWYKQHELHLNIPVTLRYNVIKGLMAEAGFQAGYLMSANLKISDGYYEGSYGRLDMYKRLNFAFVLGAAYQITDHISAGMRYNIGLNQVFEESDDPRSRVFQLYAAYRL